MRIGIVSTTFGNPWAGSEELWYQTSLKLLSEGHNVFASVFEVTTYCSQHENFKSAGGVLEYRKRFNNGRLHQLKNRLSSNYKKLFKWKPDVLLLSLGSVGDLMLHSDLKRELLGSSCKVVPICLFNADFISYPAFVREELAYYYNRSASSVFVSHHNAELLERQLAVSINGAHVFSSPTSYKFNERRRLPSLGVEERINFACAARFDAHVKGYDVLLKSFAAEEWQNRNFRLNIFGTGPDENYIRKLIELYELQDRVSLKGFVSDTRDIWKDNHFLVMASRAEGLSLAILEAMICGRVPIVTDVGDNGYVITDGVSGFLAEASMPTYFSAALNRAWNSLNQYERLCDEAEKSAMEVFAVDPVNKMCSIIASVYEK